MAAITPKTKRQAETLQDHVQKSFHGMMKDVPASELPDGYSARNLNCNDYGTCAEGRAGSRRYTTTTRPTGILNGVCNHQKAKKVIKVYGSTVWLCDKGMEGYHAVLNISGVVPEGQCTIKEYNDDAILFSTAGIFLIVLSDYFYYMRLMNEPLPTDLIVDVQQTYNSMGVSQKPYGYRYTYSLLQKSGNGSGDWDRLTEGFPPVFESGTCKSDETGKDFGECYFQYETAQGIPHGRYMLSPELLYNIVGDLKVPAGVYDVTHFGIYRTKNIGQNSSPPGAGISADALGNNEALMIWCADIPVAKAFTITADGGTVTASQGTFSKQDVGSILYFGVGQAEYEILTYISPTQVTIADQSTFGPISIVIGGGRSFPVYQSGVTIKIPFHTYNAGFEVSDEGKPIFLANGQVVWCKTYIDHETMIAAFPQNMAQQAATMAPVSGNFSRKFRDTIKDRLGNGEITLTDRVDAGDTIYFPRRYYSPLPSGEIGHVDKGFLYVAKRDDTTWQYADIGDLKYRCGYYRANSQMERVETHIRQILSVGSALAIIMSNKTRVASPGVATDIGNAQIGESIFIIPPSQICDNSVGVIAWQSIVFKGNGLIYAITNEPAVRTFDGTAWSTTNYAKDQVQKDLEAMDMSERVVAVYIPGKYGGYTMWFKKWELS
jgi:hypothetical protein